jgi:DNA-directed RNA polymerase beta' subunit
LMELNALLAAGAPKVIRDAHMVRGHRNEEYWRAFRMGQTVPAPKAGSVLPKFLAQLAGAGIHVGKQGDQLNIMAMTDDNVTEISRGEITKAETVSFPALKPIPGGLFDRAVTGGHGGDRFGHITLPEPLPNPVLEGPIRQILGISAVNLREILSGDRELKGKTGPKAVYAALKSIDIDAEYKATLERTRTAKNTPRNVAIKKLRVLDMLKKTKLSAEDMMITRVPVLPPSFRPISMMKDVPLVNGVNLLYSDLLNAKNTYSDLTKDVGEENAGEDRLAVYDALKAVVGLGDPITRETKQQGARGLLKSIFGTSPKLGLFQRKLMGATTTLGGRSVITPDPRLSMDEVGLPGKIAWRIFSPFMMRDLVQGGMTPVDAAQAIADQAEPAKKALTRQMKKRPVIINRAPSLHRHSIMGAWPTLTAGDSIRIPPVVTSSFNADFDGDTMAVHVPVSKEAVDEVIERLMPTKQLIDSKFFKAHMLPRQEYQLGLWRATAKAAKSMAAPVVFNTATEAMKAYRDGTITIDTPIRIEKPITRAATGNMIEASRIARDAGL